MAKAINFQKLSAGMTEISAQSLHRGPVADPIVGGVGKRAKHFHTCQSILFNNVVKMLKISQPVTFFPHPPLYQPQASWGILVSSIAAIMFNHDRGNWQNSVNSVFYYCVYSIILL